MNRHSIIRLSLGLAVALAAACGDDDGDTFDAAPIDAVAPPDVRLPVDARQGDGNDDFDTAEILNIGSGSAEASDAINPPGDDDYFQFEGTAGDWVLIYTSTELGEGDPDTVITLYDESHTQVAQDDDALPWVGTDSELIIKLPATGTYFVQVQEWSDWTNDAGGELGGPSFTYDLGVAVVDPATASDAIIGDSESGPVALELRTETTAKWGYVLGAFDAVDDEDVFTFTITAPTEGTHAWTSIAVMPGGTGGADDTGFGSTDDAGEFQITNEAGDTVIAKVNYAADGRMELSPALPAGNYQLKVKHEGGTLGANAFYVLKIVTSISGDNPAEAEVAGTPSNDTLATAEAIAMEANDAGGRSGFILAFIDPVATDVDYFSFTVQAGEAISLACGSAQGGSGVDDLRAEIRNSSDTAISGGTATETFADGIGLQDVSVSGAGTYYLRLNAAGGIAGVTGTWVRCGVHAN